MTVLYAFVFVVWAGCHCDHLLGVWCLVLGVCSMGNPPSRAMPNPPESPLSVDSDSAISDDTAVKMEHPTGEELGKGSSSPGGATRLSTVHESAPEPRGETADSRPEEIPVVSDAPQEGEPREIQETDPVSQRVPWRLSAGQFSRA